VLWATSARAERTVDDVAPADAADDDSHDTAEPRLIGPTIPTARREPDWPGHRHQFGIAVQVGAGLRGIKPYDDIYCGERGTDGAVDAPACIGRQPIGVDLALSWGASASVELLVEARVGLERDFGATPGAGAGPRSFRLAPGARFYFSESGRTSFFSTLQAMVDLTGYQDERGRERETDLGVRNVNGFLFDFDRAYGLYLYVGETLSFRRWLAGELEAGLGFQGRYP
jgi:hypothetical protein